MELVRRELESHGVQPQRVGTRSGLDELQYPALVVFIDEVHLVPRGVQESLLTVLEQRDRTMTLNDEVARLDQATFIFATTQASKLDAAFRSRCVGIELREYSEAEVARIVADRVPRDWSPEVYVAIARLGRLVPRVALEIARDLDNEILVSTTPGGDPRAHLNEIRNEREVDINGLGPLDRRYLTVLQEQGGPVGERAMIRMLGTVDEERVVTEIEPVLRRMGLVKFGPRGRELTREGMEYLATWRRSSGS
jgi:Holliday junction DNA helicase RuvB